MTARGALRGAALAGDLTHYEPGGVECLLAVAAKLVRDALEREAAGRAAGRTAVVPRGPPGR